MIDGTGSGVIVTVIGTRVGVTVKAGVLSWLLLLEHGLSGRLRMVANAKVNFVVLVSVRALLTTLHYFLY